MNQKLKGQSSLLSGVLRNCLPFQVLFYHAILLFVDIPLKEFLDFVKGIFEWNADNHEECSEDEGAKVVSETVFHTATDWLVED